jgi:hypothetical protein
MTSGATTRRSRTTLTSCIAGSGLIAAACGASTPSSTLQPDAGHTVVTESFTEFKVGDRLWVGLPVLQVVGKATLRMVSVRFVHYPNTGLSQPRFYRTLYTSTGDTTIGLFDDAYWRQQGDHVDGPFRGTTLIAGHEDSYPIASFIIRAAGTYRVRDVVVRYAEPDGNTRTQLFHYTWVIGTNGGS